ncbi:hypothetical protein OAP57_00345 [bacterium]|nr:hypothetical protein [bacterium]
MKLNLYKYIKILLCIVFTFSGNIIPQDNPSFNVDGNLSATSLSVGNISNTEIQYLNGVTSSIQTQLNAKGAGTVSSLSDLSITSTAAELNYVDGVTSNIQTQLNAKGTGTVSSLSDLSITSTAAELNYVDGVTSNIQTQLNSKQDAISSGIGHKYIEITVNGTDGNFDLSSAIGSNNEWYHIEPIRITEWDGLDDYFSLTMEVYYNGQSTAPNFGQISISKQSYYIAPKLDLSSNIPIYSESNDGQHVLVMNSQGRDVFLKILLKVTSDWSS